MLPKKMKETLFSVSVECAPLLWTCMCLSMDGDQSEKSCFATSAEGVIPNPRERLEPLGGRTRGHHLIGLSTTTVCRTT
jgi:hypothetical protein